MSELSLNALAPAALDHGGSAAETVLARSLPGAVLAATREAAGLSIEQVASQLNLAPRQVVALEQDDFAALPGMVIVRGFLRAYAKLLKIDPVPLIASLGDLNPPAVAAAPMRHALSASFSESRLPSLGRSGNRSRTTPVVAGIAALVVAMIGAYAAGWWPDRLVYKVGQLKVNGTPVPGAAAKTGVTGVAGVAGVGSGSDPLPVATVDATTAPAGTILTPGSVAGGSAPQSPQSPQLPVVAVPAAIVSPPIEAPMVALSAAGANPLVLTMREDSWVELRRADNTTLVAKVFRAGTVETFDLNEPVTLVVGNIAGVTATLRGASLGLAAGANGNVARLRLK